jgi:hypothetical protein
MSQDLMPDWWMATLSELASKAPFGDGRVSLGFGFDFMFLPKEVVQGIFKQVESLGIKLKTIHYGRNAIFGRSNSSSHVDKCFC